MIALGGVAISCVLATGLLWYFGLRPNVWDATRDGSLQRVNRKSMLWPRGRPDQMARLPGWTETFTNPNWFDIDSDEVAAVKLDERGAVLSCALYVVGLRPHDTVPQLESSWGDLPATENR